MILVLQFHIAPTQNLVKNGSFEQYYTCTDAQGQLNYVQNWFEPYPCSADYFNACGNQTTGVPKNFAGFQQAQENYGYIGVGMYGQGQGSGVREFAEGELNTPVEQGKKYCVEFYVSLTLSEEVLFQYAINNIGCLFTTDTFIPDSYGTCVPSSHPIPQIENTQGVIVDSLNWVKISGEFIAQGGEKFLTIGNFRSDSNTTAVFLVDSLSVFGFAYYYIDNVSVTLCDTVGVNEKGKKFAFAEIFPNPNYGNMQLQYQIGNDDKAILHIYDVSGKLLWMQLLPPKNNMLEINNFTIGNGIYYYQISINGISSINKKLVIIK